MAHRKVKHVLNPGWNHPNPRQWPAEIRVTALRPAQNHGVMIKDSAMIISFPHHFIGLDRQIKAEKNNSTDSQQKQRYRKNNQQRISHSITRNITTPLASEKFFAYR